MNDFKNLVCPYASFARIGRLSQAAKQRASLVSLPALGFSEISNNL